MVKYLKFVFLLHQVMYVTNTTLYKPVNFFSLGQISQGNLPSTSTSGSLLHLNPPPYCSELNYLPHNLLHPHLSVSQALVTKAILFLAGSYHPGSTHPSHPSSIYWAHNPLPGTINRRTPRWGPFVISCFSLLILWAFSESKRETIWFFPKASLLLFCSCQTSVYPSRLNSMH